MEIVLFLLLAPYTIEAGRMDIINGEIKEFSGGVKVKAGDFLLFGDKGKVHGDTAWITGNLKIIDSERIITGGRGYYNKAKKIGYISVGVEMEYKNQQLKCDSLMYNRKKNFVKLTNNVRLSQKKSFISCDRGIYDFSKKKMKFLGNPTFLNKGKDTLSIASDTIFYGVKDSVFTFIKNVQIKSGKTSGNAKSLKFHQKKNIAMLTGNPVIFSATDTLTGDSIYLYSSDEGIDSVFCVVSKTFSKNKDGITRLQSDNGKIIFMDGKPQKFYFEGSVKGIFVKNEIKSKESK